MASHTTKYGQPGRYNSSLPTVPDGDGAALAVDSSGRLLVISAGSSGTSSVNIAQIGGNTVSAGNGVSGTGVLRVTLASDSTGNIATIGTSVTPGTAAANLGKAVDSVAGATDTGVASLFVRKDTPATLTPADGDYTRGMVDSFGLKWVREYYAPLYEDNTIGVAKVEHRYTPFTATADTLVKTGAGFIHALTISPTTATPTAGLVTIYDNTAESGTVLYSEWVFATAVGHGIILDASFSTGLYVGFDATLASVRISGSYR